MLLHEVWPNITDYCSQYILTLVEETGIHTAWTWLASSPCPPSMTAARSRGEECSCQTLAGWPQHYHPTDNSSTTISEVTSISTVSTSIEKAEIIPWIKFVTWFAWQTFIGIFVLLSKMLSLSLSLPSSCYIHSADFSIPALISQFQPSFGLEGWLQSTTVLSSSGHSLKKISTL